MSSPATPPTQRRAPVVLAILVLLILAGVANATIKRNRDVARSAPSAALTTVALRAERASSTAWYCAGPLPLGDKRSKASLVLANVSETTISGELSVATAGGVLTSEPVGVADTSSLTIPLLGNGKRASASATVLADGAGLAVSEEIVGKGGTEISPCVDHASQTQYIAGGATTRPNTVSLALYDPGATPSVASVSFATPNGEVLPPAYQGLPISAGSTLTIDVGRYLPAESLLGITVGSTGGPVVVGAVESTLTTKGTVLPSLVQATAVAEKSWWFGPAPSGTTTRQKFSLFNPGGDPASIVVKTSGQGGSATENVLVPAGGVAEISPAADAAIGATRWAAVTSDQPVVVSRSTALFGPEKVPAKSAHPVSGASLVIAGLPSGFAISTPTPELAKSWLIGDGESDAGEGELVLMANPSTSAAEVGFEVMTAGAAPESVVVPAGGSRIVSVPTAGTGTIVIVTSDEPVVVDSGNYARGSTSPVGWSSPGAIVVN